MTVPAEAPPRPPEVGSDSARVSLDGGPSYPATSSQGSSRLHPTFLLGWVYIGRLALASSLLLVTGIGSEQIGSAQIFATSVLFLTVLAVTAWGAWTTHLRKEHPYRAFLFAQMAFDACMVTAVVHLTGGVESVFTALYIPVIGLSAVILPAPGVGLIGGLSGILYLADAVWGQGLDVLTGSVLLQITLFGVVAMIAGVLGDRLRRTGVALGEVESELRRLRLDTDEILASVTSGILTVDVDGRMVYLNPAGESLLGLDPRRWSGFPVLDRVEEVAPELGDIFRQSLGDGISRYRRTARARRDHEELILGVTMTVRDVEGEPRAVTAVFQDITDEEQLALLNRQNERLEAVAALAASMAHEIRNPMASIRSAVEQFTSPRITDRDRTALSRMVMRESDRLNRLLSDFLDFAKVRVATRDTVELSRVVGDVVEVVRQHPETERRSLRVEATLPAGPVRMIGDADVLYRAVLNLALNAVQFSPEGASVEVSLEDLRDGGAPALGVDRPLRIRVRDHGPGIPQADLPKLFDPFFTTRKEGSGLGLAMVHRAVEAHRGAIVVEDAPGGGAEFILYLPGEAEMPVMAEVDHG